MTGCWIDPKGVTYPCNPLEIEGHMVKAKELFPDEVNPERFMEKSGWIKTLASPIQGMVFIPCYNLTQKQIDSLSFLALLDDGVWGKKLVKQLKELDE